MKLHNLEKYILYRVCEELARGNKCGSLSTEFIYRTFADIPTEEITNSIASLANRGWLRLDESRTYVDLTSRGRSKIRTSIPDVLCDKCDTKVIC